MAKGTTIGFLNFGIDGDNKELLKKIEQVKKEAISVEQYLQNIGKLQSKNGTNKVPTLLQQAKAQDVLNQSVEKQRLIQSRTNEIIQRTVNSQRLNYQRLQTEIALTNNLTLGLGDNTSNLQNLLLKVGGTAAFIQLAKEIINVRGEMQQLDIAFSTMLKSPEKAAKLMSELKDFAVNTPFGLMDSAKGAKQLIAYGFQANTLIKDLEMLGDVAAGVSAPINDIIYLYGTLRTQGRAYAVDMRQFANRGIPIYGEIAKVLGINKDEVMEFVSAGKVGFKEVEQAFRNMTSEAGMYGGLMRKQTESVTGQLEKLKDNIQLMFNNIGESSEGAIYTAINGASSLVENYEVIGKVLLGLVATYGAYKTAVMLTAVAENIRYQAALAQMAGYTKMGALTEILKVKTEALNKTLLSNPYAILAAAAVALAYGIYQVATSTSELEESQSRINKATEDFNASVEGERAKLDILFNRLKNAKEGTNEYQKAKDDILKKADTYHKGLSKDIDLLNDVAGAYAKISAAAIQAAKDRAIEKGSQDALDSYTKSWGKNITKIQKEFISKFGEGQGTILLDSLKESLNNDAELSKAVTEAISSFSKTIYTAYGTAGQGQSYESNWIDVAVQDIRKSKNIMKSEVADLQNIFGKRSEGNDDADNTPIKTLTEQTKEAKDNIIKLNSELKKLRSGETASNNYSKDIEDKSKELKEAQDKLSLLLYGKTSSVSNKDTKYEESTAQKIRDAYLKVLNTQVELDNESIKQQIDYEQKLLDIEQDSFDKRYRQNQLNLLKEFQSVEEYRQKTAKAQQDAAKDVYVSKNGSDKGFDFSTFDMSLLPDGLKPSDVEAQVKSLTDAALATFRKGNADISKELQVFANEERLTFASQLDQQIYSIRAHYVERRQLAKGNADLLKQVNENENKEIIAARLQANQKRLEADADYNQKYQQLIEDRFVFESDKQRASLEQEIKSQTTLFNNLEKQVLNDPNNDELAKQLKAAYLQLKLLNKELEKTKGQKLSEIADFAGSIFTSLGSMSGVDFSPLSGVLSGLASFSNSDPLGGISSGLGVVSGIVSSIISKKDQEAAIQRELNKLQQEYNINLREQNFALIESIDYSRIFKDNVEALNWLVQNGFISDVDYSAWEAFNKQTEVARSNLDAARKSLDTANKKGADFLNEAYRLRDNPIWGKLSNITNDWKNGIISTEEAMRRVAASGWKGASNTADEIARAKDETEKWKDQLAELSQQMDEFATGTNFDSFLSDAASAINDLRGNVSGLADFTEERLTNAILSSFKYQILSEALKPMYDELADMFLDGDYDASTANSWKQRLTDILKTNSKELDKIFDAFGINPNTSGSSSNTISSSAQSLTEDTGNILSSYINAMRAEQAKQGVYLSQIIAIANLHTDQFANMYAELLRIQVNTLATANNTARLVTLTEDIKSTSHDTNTILQMAATRGSGKGFNLYG